jgi:hypothetical protein
LLLAAALALFHAVPLADTSAQAYGRDLVARYELPPEQVALYRAHAGPGSARTQRTPHFDPLQWVGPQQAVGSGRNPYKLTLTLHGTAPKAGDVRTHWQAGWEVQESQSVSRNLLMPIAALSSGSVNAGTPLTLTVVGTPVSFRNERLAAPTLNLVDARNFELHSVSVAVWSGDAPWVWPMMSASHWALLLIGMLCVWAWFALGRTPRPMATATSSVAATTTLPPSAADLQTLLVHRGAMPPAPSVLPTTAPPAETTRADHAAHIVAALRDVLGAGLVVPTVLDDRRSRKSRGGLRAG